MSAGRITITKRIHDDLKKVPDHEEKNQPLFDHLYCVAGHYFDVDSE